MASRIDLGMRGERKTRGVSGLRSRSRAKRTCDQMSKLFREEKLGTGKGSWRLKRFRVRGWSEKC